MRSGRTLVRCQKLERCRSTGEQSHVVISRSDRAANVSTERRLGCGHRCLATNCYHLYPAHAAFGGYKQSGFGRETHKMMLSHYQQTKNLLVSYSPKALGFF